MKTIVNNYIYDKYNERGMKTFENKVAKLLKENEINGKIICHNAYMERGSGKGSYYNTIEIEINSELHKLRQYTNDSMAWDEWENPTPKDKRNLFLAVLGEEIKTFCECGKN